MPYNSVKDLPANVQKLPAKSQRQWMHVWNSSFQACMAKDEGGTASCESEAFRKANGVVKGAEMPNSVTNKFYDSLIRLEKGSPKTNYRASDGQDWQCGDCRFFDAPYRACSLVEGTIEATYTCDLWTEKLPSQPDYGEMLYSEQTVQIFMEAPQIFAQDLSKPTWIPFLPTPGKFKHPLYGEIDVTAKSNQEMVDSVKNVVYQEHIPLDAEHETKLSGAVGWITDMRMNSNKSADALVEWTDRGRALAGGDTPQFKYVSPEWFDSWTDPATKVVHHNVIAGGAITTRPFFKDKVLRALVASEAGVQFIDKQEDTKVPDPKADPKVDPKTYKEGTPEYDALVASIKTEAAKGLLDPESKEFKDKIEAAVAEAKKAAEVKDPAAPEPTKEFTELTARVTAAEAANIELKTANDVLAKSLTEIKNADRHRRFTDLVAGKGGENDGGAWIGDKDKHVAFLEGLADKIGEADPMFVSHVEQMNAAAAQAAESNLFGAMGSGAPAVGGAEGRLEALVQARIKADPAKPLGYSEAMAAVMETPEGAKAYAEINEAHMARNQGS